MTLTYQTSYFLTRFIFQRAMGCVYLIAFLVAFNQFRPLLGEQGLLPVPKFLKHTNFWQTPSLFHFFYSDTFFSLIAGLGIILSLFVMLGLSEKVPLWAACAAWLLLWVFYLSIVNVGQTFYSFGWET